MLPVCLFNTTDVNEVPPAQGSEELGQAISSEFCFEAFKGLTLLKLSY